MWSVKRCDSQKMWYPRIRSRFSTLFIICYCLSNYRYLRWPGGAGLLPSLSQFKNINWSFLVCAETCHLIIFLVGPRFIFWWHFYSLGSPSSFHCSKSYWHEWPPIGSGFGVWYGLQWHWGTLCVYLPSYNLKCCLASFLMRKCV